MRNVIGNSKKGVVINDYDYKRVFKPRRFKQTLWIGFTDTLRDDFNNVSKAVQWLKKAPVGATIVKSTKTNRSTIRSTVAEVTDVGIVIYYNELDSIRSVKLSAKQIRNLYSD